MEKREKFVLFTLESLVMLSVLYFSQWWFFGGHEKIVPFFVILSFGIFWNIFKNVINSYTYMFIKKEGLKELPKNFNGSADVLTTAMPGEPYEMFEKTLEAIVKMDYSHNTFLLDGGNDAKLMKLCEELGVQHINCSNVQGAKAGKVNYCLQNFSKSDFIFIVDPDHIPRKDFLTTVLPHFQDESVGFVQVVQAYYNLDESFVAYAAAEQTFGFYGPTQMGLNGLAIPTAIGANCVFRRSALDKIGGHAEDLAEDALTSMRLHAAGYKSVYLPYRGTSGLAPADLGAYFKQQIKWSTGMFNLLFKQYPRLFLKFNFVAKLHYLNAGTYYLNGLAVFVTLVLPIIFLFFKVFAVEMALTEFLIHLTPYVFFSFLLSLYVQRWYSDDSEKKFPWRSMVLERSCWHIYLTALFNAILGKNIPYLPTPKLASKGVFLKLVIPHIVISLLSVLAVFFAIFTYHRIGVGAVLMMFFACVNIVLFIPIVFIAVKNIFLNNKSGNMKTEGV